MTNRPPDVCALCDTAIDLATYDRDTYEGMGVHLTCTMGELA